MELNIKAIINEKYAPCNTRKILAGYFPGSTSGHTVVKITPNDAERVRRLHISDSFVGIDCDVDDINEPLPGGKNGNSIGHFLAMQANWVCETYDSLFEAGYNIFQKNKSGVSLAHNIQLHRYYYIWLSRKFNIPIEAINKEFEEYGNENPLCRIANLVERSR